MFVAMNRFRIQPDFADAFLKRWQERDRALDRFEGFFRFRLLRTELRDAGSVEFVSYTEWRDESCFLNWLENGSRAAHSDKTPLPREAYQGPPEFRGYHVALDEVPGARTDFRSAAMDILVENRFAHESTAQKQIREAALAQGFPPISIGPFEGRLLEVILRASGARRGVEVGTLGGYSASWLARALPADGELITIERETARAEFVKAQLPQLGLEKKVRVECGDARDVLTQRLAHLSELDFVFIDADKENYPNYLEWALARVRKGGLIFCDNAYIWGGMHYDTASESLKTREVERAGRLPWGPNVMKGMSATWRRLEHHPEFASLILPTGEGMAIAVRI